MDILRIITGLSVEVRYFRTGHLNALFFYYNAPVLDDPFLSPMNNVDAVDITDELRSIPGNAPLEVKGTLA